MTHLALIVPHLPGETITSFVSRIAYRNGYDSAGIFCGDVGLDWKAIIRGDDSAFDEVAKLTGAASGRLLQSSVRTTTAGKMLIGSEIGTHTLIKKSAPRICPACLVEDRHREGRFGGAGRVTWTITAIHRCHLHGQALMTLATDAPPVKAHDLHPIIRKNWSAIAARASETAVNLPETSLERYLRQRISGVPSGIWPDRLPLYVAARTSEMLGCRILFGPEQSFRKLAADEMRDAGAAGFDVLAGGPDRLREELRSFERSAHEVRAYHHRDYGRFFTWLSASRTSAEFDPIRDIVRDHILDQYPREEGAIVLGKPVSSRKLYTLEAARRELHVGLPRLKNLMRNRGLLFDMSGGNADHGVPVVTRDQFEVLRLELDGWLSAVEAGKILGITADQVRRLMAAGFFETRRLQGRASLCPRHQVNRLLAIIDDLPVGPADGYRPIRSVLTGSISLPELVAGLLEGRLSARRISGKTGIPSLLLRS